MIPVRLKLEGFLSYKEPVVLDFTGFDLACISGPNGAGKSSLLDAITWALFGNARTRGESVINTHPSVEAAEVTLDFVYEGNLYRVQRTNPRGKTSIVEFYIDSQTSDGGDDWKPLTGHGVRDTERKIVDTLRMDYDTFTNASFFLQGKADQFATAGPAERKKILGSILGLEVWESYREEARERRRALEGEINTLNGRLAEVDKELGEEEARKAHLKELEARLEALAAQRKNHEERLADIRRRKADLEEHKKLVATLKDQLESEQASLNRIDSVLEERREEKSTYDALLSKAEAIEKAYQAWQEARQALEEMDIVADQFRQHEALRHDPLAAIRAEEARLKQEKKSLISQKESLDAALAQREAIEKALSDARDRKAAAEAQLEERAKLDETWQDLQADQAEAKAENPRLRDEMHELRSRIDQLEAAEGVECPLCGQPLSAEERQTLVAVLNEKGKALADRFRANKILLDNFEKRLEALGAAKADLSGAEAALREATRQVDQLENQLENLRQQEEAWQNHEAPRLAEISRALEEEDYASAARETLLKIDRDLAGIGYDLDVHDQLRETEQSGRDAEADLRSLEQARAALVPIEREIVRLTEELAERIQKVQDLTEAHDAAAAKFAASAADMPDLVEAEADFHDLQEQENRLRMEVGAARQKVVVLDTVRKRRAEFLAEMDEINHQIADFKQLERAFGKDGVPALLIEQALPEISETTNRLLSRLTNGRMTFKFVTQRELKDSKRDDLKETLDIVISDNMGERDYEMFSGGEAFRVNFSIRLALSEVLAHRAGARLQTLVIDEGFGSQDAQGRQRLVEAINLVRDDFEKILVITHLESLKEVFPNRIEVEKTENGSQLQVV